MFKKWEKYSELTQVLTILNKQLFGNFLFFNPITFIQIPKAVPFILIREVRRNHKNCWNNWLTEEYLHFNWDKYFHSREQKKSMKINSIIVLMASKILKWISLKLRERIAESRHFGNKIKNTEFGLTKCSEYYSTIRQM
jgi:hypothetical protein